MSLFHCRTVLGKDGVPFTQYKIRTMHPGSEFRREEVLEKNGLDGLGKPCHDPRITSLGRVIRRWGIDELPQIYNVIKGDMSLIGIRPHTEHEWSRFSENRRSQALKYRPGLFPAPLADGVPNTFEDLIVAEQTYLTAKGAHPFKTDVTYLTRFAYQCIWNGLRSR